MERRLLGPEGGCLQSLWWGFISWVFSLGLELPRINYAHNGKRYRYVFAAEVQWSPIPTKVLIPVRLQPTTMVSACEAEFSI